VRTGTGRVEGPAELEACRGADGVVMVGLRYRGIAPRGEAKNRPGVIGPPQMEVWIRMSSGEDVDIGSGFADPDEDDVGTP
jgi:hypothetical protein